MKSACAVFSLLALLGGLPGCGTIVALSDNRQWPNQIYAVTRASFEGHGTQLDVPLSLVADTIVLPYTIPRTMQNQRNPWKRPSRGMIEWMFALGPTREDDKDGSKFVWLLYEKSGYSYSYVGAKSFPTTVQFREVEKLEEGDVAWWEDFVGIYCREDGKVRIITGHVRLLLSDLETKYGPAKFFRYYAPE